MSDRGILEKYVDLEISCLSESEKERSKYKGTFSLRDKIDT